MIDWKQVKRLVIPEGVVRQVARGGMILWGRFADLGRTAFDAAQNFRGRLKIADADPLRLRTAWKLWRSRAALRAIHPPDSRVFTTMPSGEAEGILGLGAAKCLRSLRAGAHRFFIRAAVGNGARHQTKTVVRTTVRARAGVKHEDWNGSRGTILMRFGATVSAVGKRLTLGSVRQRNSSQERVVLRGNAQRMLRAKVKSALSGLRVYSGHGGVLHFDGRDRSSIRAQAGIGRSIRAAARGSSVFAPRSRMTLSGASGTARSIFCSLTAWARGQSGNAVKAAGAAASPGRVRLYGLEAVAAQAIPRTARFPALLAVAAQAAAVRSGKALSGFSSSLFSAGQLNSGGTGARGALGAGISCRAALSVKQSTETEWATPVQTGNILYITQAYFRQEGGMLILDPDDN